MVKTRLIPVVLLRNGQVVQSKRFKRYQLLGNPMTIIERLSDWASDELIYLDISREDDYDIGRDDTNSSNHKTLLEILQEISRKCFVPMTFGGRIRSLEDATRRILSGADKVSINTGTLETPSLIDECAKEFGSQCVVVSIDALQTGDATWEVYGDGGRRPTGREAAEWAREAQERGAGEILLNAVHRDGTGRGYDLDLLKQVAGAIQIPLIACGGVGEWEHFFKAASIKGVTGLAAANIFNYSENSVYEAKKYLYEKGVPLREPALGYALQ